MGGAIWDFVSPGLTERIRQVDDLSPFHTPAHLMGNARLVKEGKNTVLDLERSRPMGRGLSCRQCGVEQ